MLSLNIIEHHPHAASLMVSQMKRKALIHEYEIIGLTNLRLMVRLVVVRVISLISARCIFYVRKLISADVVRDQKIRSSRAERFISRKLFQDFRMRRVFTSPIQLVEKTFMIGTHENETPANTQDCE